MRKEKQTSVVTLQDVNLILCGQKFNSWANTTVTHCVSWTKYVGWCRITEDWGLGVGRGARECRDSTVHHVLYRLILLVSAQTAQVRSRLSKHHQSWSLYKKSNLVIIRLSQIAPLPVFSSSPLCQHLCSKLPNHVGPPAGGLKTRRDTHTSRASTGRHFNDKLLRRRYTEVLSLNKESCTDHVCFTSLRRTKQTKQTNQEKVAETLQKRSVWCFAQR